MPEENNSDTDGPTDDPIEPKEPWLLVRQRQLLTSAGYRAMALMDGVKRISSIFHANVTQYMALVAKLQELRFFLPIMDMRNPGAHDDLLSEAERLLHNVLTSMSTRVDQQRAFIERHFSDDVELTGEYRENVASKFIGNLQVSFLKDLRNHITHHLLPVARSRQTFSDESISIRLVLPCAPLLEWDWSSGVKEWIASCGEAVSIVDVVHTYARKAADFDKWLFERVGLKYATEIQEFQQVRGECTREFDQVFGV
jgi:hypothetical protein